MPTRTDSPLPFAPGVYAVGREKIREYALAVGETDPLHFDPAVAHAAGYADVVAPPMFAAVYTVPALRPTMRDPALGIEYSRMVQGAQLFEWEQPVVAGDELTTTGSVGQVFSRGRLTFYVFESESVNQRGELVCRGRCTNIVRP